MLKRLKIWQKFTLIAVAFSIPIIVLAYFLLIETSKNIAYTEAEMDGANYLRPMHALVVDVSAHRDLAALVLSGDATGQADLDKLEAKIDADLKALEAVDVKYGAGLATTTEVKQVRQQWQALRGSMTGAKPEQSFEAHKTMIRGLHRLTYRIGNNSNLILDPEVSSYYVSDALIFKIPRLSEEIGQARAAGLVLLVTGATSEKRLPTLAPLSFRIEDALDQEIEFIKFAFKHDASVEQALSGLVAQNADTTRSFLTDLTEKVIAPDAPMSAKDYLLSSAKPLDAQDKLWEAHRADDRLLASRLQAMNKTRMTEIAAVIVALALTLLLLTVVVRAITRPVAHLSQVADRISLGEMDAKIGIDSLDEIGELGERFRRMQVSLKAAMEALEKQDDDSGL